MITSDDVRLLIQWAQDVDEGEMIEYRQTYTRDRFEFHHPVTYDELSTICNLVNPILCFIGVKRVLVAAHDHINSHRYRKQMED